MSHVVTLAQALGSRERQEDRAHAELIGDCVVAVLADGMGGHYGGDLAATAAVDAVMEKLQAVAHMLADDNDPNTVALVLDLAVDAAVYDVREIGRGSGCTLLIALVWEDRLVIRHVGDSAAYLVSVDQQVSTLTRPHSLYGRITSYVPGVDASDTIHLRGVHGRLVLTSDGIEPEAVLESYAEDVVRRQMALGKVHQDNATAIVIPLGVRIETVRALVTVEPEAPPAPPPKLSQEGAHFRWSGDASDAPAACGATEGVFVDLAKATCPACRDEIPF